MSDHNQVKRQCPLHHYPGLGSLSYSVLFVRAVPDPLTMEATPQMDAAAWEWCRGLGCKPESIPDLVNNRHKYEAVWDGVMEALEAVNKVSQIEYPIQTQNLKKIARVPHQKQQKCESLSFFQQSFP